MKSIKTFSILILLAFIFNTSADARPQHHHNRGRNPKPTIGAPLDGGLLVLLGAAGAAAFYGVRKRKGK